MNRLQDETSPYLRQHMHNPVDWYPWGDEALQKAKDEDKPILLSVGYSACHWCHVMERESFEDEATAAVMNELFVNIKVDREERPDVDELYMRAVQAFQNGSGGWPMTVFLTPEGKPFYAGTYFPPDDRRGMPSFKQVMAYVSGQYSDMRDRVDQVTGQVMEHLEQTGRLPASTGPLGGDWLGTATDALKRDFDARWGGFGKAPKFPPCGSLALLLAHHHTTGDARSLRTATATLDAMARGGMYDVLGGGFARYSVDAEWRVPHFEKMLYDNGQLVPLYVDAWLVTGHAHHARIARESCEWAVREMTLESGAFAASQDADTNGVEGLFFIWTPEEIREVVGVLDGLRVCALLQVTPEGTFEHGASVLRLESPLETLPEADRTLLGDALPKLFAARAIRTPPPRDDKVVASWNGLMIQALARTGDVLQEPRYVAAACAAAEVLLGPMSPDGRLHRTWKDDRLGAKGFLDDHANLLAGLLALWEATWDRRWVREALSLADRTIELFWDSKGGGLFLSGSDNETLVSRSKAPFGGATPSGNSVCALAFSRLELLCGRTDLGDAARTILESLQPLLERAPRALGLETIAAAMQTGRALEIGLVGEPPELIEELRQTYTPLAVRVAGPVDAELFPWMSGREGLDGTAFVCERGTCLVPTKKAATLRKQLAERPKPVRKVRVHAPALPTDPSAWLNGGPVDTAGQIVVLDFWTYCCINCMHVLPVLERIEERFEDAPVVVIGVHSAKFTAEHDPNRVQAAIDRHRVRHPVVNDPTHTVWSEFAVKSWPTVAVVDPTGCIAWQKPGEATFEALEAEILTLLDEHEADLAPSTWTARALPDSTTELRHPGKVQAWPNDLGQARGEDPFSADARVYISDTGHGRVVEYRVDRDDEGWPSLTETQVIRGFAGPQGVDREGSTLYVADTEDHTVHAIDLASAAPRAGEDTIVAGTGELGSTFSPGSARATPLRSPWDVVATQGHVFVAMAGSHQIWLLSADEDRIHPFIGSGSENHVDGKADEAALAQPSSMVLMGRYLFWADSETSSIRVYDLSEGTVGTVLGKGLFDFGDLDGMGQEVLMQHPLGLAARPGAIFVADTFNNKIKRVELPGSATRTIADGFSEPGGCTLLGEFLLVADTNHHRVVALKLANGEVRTLVG
ncbi:MAG: DUF255 domain-containing protein [Proteobacteria bacterium]|nr:DUF255 domain-containing protein [Pseudomonadota bacterium]